MVATTLSVGQMAIIGVNTEDNGNPQRDAITFILLRPVGSGTQIFFTDRAWNGTAFAALSAGENTFTFTAATDLAAGTVITITQAQLTAAGINLADTGETVYAYQGAINAPTTFLHAVDLADGTIGFDGTELTNTGLVSGTSAVALNVDNAEMGTRSHNINALEYFRQVNNNTDWVQNDNSPQDGTQHSSGPGTNFTHAYTAPDSMLIVAGSGAGEAIVTINLDATYNSGTIGYQIVQAFQNAANLFHPSDITLDTVNDKYFFVDADLSGNNRIIQGSISELLNNPGQVPTFTVLYSNTGTGAVNSMRTLSIDTVNQKIYFDLEQAFVRINYDTAGQTPTVLRDLEPIFGSASYITQMTINYATGTVYLASSSVTSVFGSDFVDSNRVFTATGLTGSNAANSMTFTEINWGANGDTSIGGEGSPLGNNHWPVERGTVRGIDVDPVTGLVWIVTGTVILDNDGDGFTTYRGGVWTYNPSTGAVVNVYTQNGVTGPVGLLYYIEVDNATGRYYVVDESGANAVVGDGGVWSGSITGPFPATPTLVATVGNINGLGPQGLEIQHAPTLTGTGNPGLAVTEASSAPNSGETARVDVFSALTASDIDTAGGDELRGAVVRVSGNFVYEAASTATGHTGTVDFLRINNLTSGTIAGSGITFTYDQTTGMMVLSGVATVAEYAAALDLVQFSTSGDNVTGDGNALTRTISASVFDGLLYSDEITATVTVTGINDAPVNTLGAVPNFTEDTTGTAGVPAPPPAPVNAITGLAIADADADATTEIFTVTLTVQHGVLNIRTDVVGGLAGGNVTGNGTATLTLTGTQTQINTTLAATNNVAAANGLVYTPAANYNGADTLTMTTNDAGNNGNDPGVSGTGTTEQDSDNLTINIADVNDAPTVGGDGTEDSPAILEDTPFTNLNAPTVATLFGGQFSDALDVQFNAGTNPTGSTGDTFAGIAVVANGSNANGNWQYWDGDSWENIGAVSIDAARTYTAATLIRFSPTLNFNGNAPTLTVRLIESGGPAIVNNGTVDLNPAPPITGPNSVYSAGSVTLSQFITAVNDAPVNTVGGTTNATEDGGAVNVTGISIADVDANLATDVFTVTLDVDHGILNLNTAVGGGVVSGEVTGNGTSTITIVATAAKINATLAAAGGLTYTPDADYNGADRVRVTTNDHGATGQDPGLTGDGTSEQDEDDKAISVAAVNDPVTGTAPASATLDEDSVNVAITGMSISDVDATLAPAGVYVVTLTSTNGTMTLTTLTGLTFSAGDGTSDATMTFRGTLADINTALATATYSPAANYNGAATITLQVTDTFGGIVATGTGAATNDTDVVNVTVSAVNDPVTGTVPATASVNEDSVDAAITGMSISDADAALAPAGVYEVTLTSTNGAMTLTTLTGLTFTTGDGTGDTTMTFHGTLADINTALATAKYTPTANYNGPATITLEVTDTFGGIVATGTGAATNDSDVINVTVNSVNDEPAGADKTIGINEDATYVLVAADFGFTDPIDGDSLDAVVLTTLPASGDLYLNNVLITVAGTVVSATDIANNLLTYKPDPDQSGTGYASFTFQVRDDGGTLNGGVDTDQSPNTITFDVASINDAPIHTVPLATQTFNEDNTLTFNAANSNLISVADADAGSADVQTTLAIQTGTLTLNAGALAALTSVTGDGTNTVVLTGTVAEINAALDGLVYNPGANYNGDRTLTVTTNDLGNTGADPGLTGTATSEEDQDAIAVDVTAINDAPVVIGDGTEEADPIVEDTPGPGETVSSLFGGQYSDAADAQFSVSNPGGSSPGSFGGIAVTANGSSVATGQWQYFNGSIWVDIGAASDAAAKLFHPSTLIRFNPALDFTGAAPTLTVHLIDNSSSAFTDGDTADLTVTGGTTPYSAGTVVLSQNVIPANAAPTLDLDADDSVAVGTGYTGAYTEGGTAAAISDTDVTITDADAGDDIVSATITITNAETGDKLNVGTLPGTVTVDISSTDTTVLLVAAPGTSAADFEAAIEAVTFSSTSDDPTDGGTNTARSITVVVNDGASNSNTATATIAITGANDAPAGTDSTITAVEDTHRVLAGADFGFTDPDSGDSLGAVIITGVTGGKLFFDSDGAGGADPVEVTVFPTAEYSAADLAAGKLTYLPNANLNGSGVGTIGFQVVDDSGAGNDTDTSANTLTVDVTPINDSPVVPNSPGIAVDEQTTITINSSITVSDVDLDARNGGAGDYEGASFVINRDVSNADDLFNFDVTGALFTVNGNDLEAGGNVFASFTQSGGILNINFNSSETVATTALVNDVLRHLQYTNLSNDPPASVTLLYGLDDGAPDAVQGALGAPFNNFDGGQVVVTLNPINDAPVNSLGGTIGTGEDAVDAWLSGMSVSDPDADPATDKIFVNFLVDNGTLGIRTDVVGGIEAGDIIAQSSETISVLATQNQINATLAASNGLTYSPDLNFNGDDTLTVTTNDLGFTGADPGLTGDATSEADVDTRTISVSAVEDPADAVDDANSVNEDALIVNASVLGNDSDPDGPPLAVTEVNGSTGDVGNEITLASGAKLTLRSDGTYDYNPNDQFNTLTDTSSGAVNTSDTDSFTYKLANGDTATVTITINGVISPEDLLFGDATDNVITGPATNDTFLMMDGGNDTVTGGGGDDYFFFGASLTGADSVNGGADNKGVSGIGDTLALRGDYNMTLDAGQLTGIERLVLRSGTPGGGSPVDYTLATTDAAVAAGTTLTVTALNLTSLEQLIFNGIAETDGHFNILGGAASDILVGGQLADNIVGGAGNDFLYGRGGKDNLTGGLGSDHLRGGMGEDVFHYDNANQSNALSMDVIEDFQTIDNINLSGIDADGNAGNGDTAFTFIGSGAFTNTAGELRATESGGVWTVEGDINGDGTADLVIEVHTVDPVPLTSEDFFL